MTPASGIMCVLCSFMISSSSFMLCIIDDGSGSKKTLIISDVAKCKGGEVFGQIIVEFTWRFSLQRLHSCNHSKP